MTNAVFDELIDKYGFKTSSLRTSDREIVIYYNDPDNSDLYIEILAGVDFDLERRKFSIGKPKEAIKRIKGVEFDLDLKFWSLKRIESLINTFDLSKDLI